MMVINNIQHNIKHSIVAYLAVLTALIELLAKSKFTVSPEIATALNSSQNRWQRLDSLTTITWKESPTCS